MSTETDGKQVAPAGAVGRAPKPYHLTSVEKTAVPAGGGNGSWCRYVLDNGRSVITGTRRGSVAQVTDHARRYAEELNARSDGRAAPSWAPRRRK